MTKRIVIDMDVLRAASRAEGGPPPGSTCRQALRTILDFCHRAVVSPELRREYDGNMSKFGYTWLVAMQSRGKVVDRAERADPLLTRQIDAAGFGANDRHLVEEDLHLVLAALETDKLVLSGDDRVRGLLTRLPRLGHVGWASVRQAGVVDWLLRDAPRGDVALSGKRPKPGGPSSTKRPRRKPR